MPLMISQYILRIHNYEIVLFVDADACQLKTTPALAISPHSFGELRQAVSNYTPHLVTFSWEAHGVRLPFFVLTRECRIALRFPNFLYLFHTLPAHVSP